MVKYGDWLVKYLVRDSEKNLIEKTHNYKLNNLFIELLRTISTLFNIMKVRVLQISLKKQQDLQHVQQT